jgi:hypothetical protein
VIQATEVVVPVALDVGQVQRRHGRQVLLQRQHSEVGEVLARLERAALLAEAAMKQCA